MKRHYILILTLLLSINIFSQQSPYYDGISSELTTETGMTLFGTLATLTANKHANYLDYTPDVWEACRVTDLDPNDGTNSNVLLIYGWESGSDGDVTNDLSRNKNNNGGSNGDWNREHTFANSLANPDLDAGGDNGTAFSDVHNLRASDVQRNGQRGNLQFASGSGNSGSSGGGWYPGDATAGGTDWRGDVARITMYMYLRYGNQCLPSYNAAGTTNSTDANMINLLLDWNTADPVSAYEDARNTYHDGSSTYSQGNRNPFIDQPYLATLIWGGTPAEDRWGTSVTDTEDPSIPTNLNVSNETSSTIDLDWTASTDNIGVTGYDIYVDGALNSSSATNSYTVPGLSASTTYSFTVLAKDTATNTSAQSSAVNGTTIAGVPSGSTCVTETFTNIPSGQSNYATRTWTGDNSGTGMWEATDARTDQSLNGNAITVRDGILTSPSFTDGIGQLTVTTQRIFGGGNGTFDLLVNDVSVGSIPFSDTEETTTVLDIDIPNNVIIKLDKSGNTDRVSIDDLIWTCYSTLSVDSYKLSEIKLYPNPTKGTILNIDTTQNLTITIFDLLGKKLIVDSVSNSKKHIDVSKLKSGAYFIKLSSKDGTTTRKFIKR
jgi:endonuclease I